MTWCYWLVTKNKGYSHITRISLCGPDLTPPQLICEEEIKQGGIELGNPDNNNNNNNYRCKHGCDRIHVTNNKTPRPLLICVSPSIRLLFNKPFL